MYVPPSDGDIDIDAEGDVQYPPLWRNGEPFWTTRESFEKFMDQEDRNSTETFEWMFSTPQSIRAHVFSLFGDGGDSSRLPCPIHGTNDDVFARMNETIELHYSNHAAGSPAPDGQRPYDIDLVLLRADRHNFASPAGYRWRTFSSIGPAFSMITEEWLLPSQLPGLCAMLRRRIADAINKEG